MWARNNIFEVHMENNRIKIAMFIDTFYPMLDGVIMVVDNYARRLSKIADVTIFAPKGRKEYDDSKFPYKVVRCKSRLPLLFIDYDLPLPGFDAKFKKELKDCNFDIVHVHSPFSLGKVGLKYAKKHNIPAVATMHSQFSQDFYRSTHSKLITKIMIKKIMKIFNGCDECWTMNDKVRDVFLSYGAIKTPKIQKNGTDLKLIEDTARLDSLRTKYGIKDGERVFLFVGRIDRLKNIFLIVDALKILKDSGFKFKMIFVGAGIDEKELQTRVEARDLQNEVIMTGKITDREEIACHYALADLFLFPSLYDTNSLVQIEAASQKTPTLFLRGAVTAGTVTEDVNGFMCEESPDAYAIKIIEIFKDEEFYNIVSENAHRDLYVLWDDVVKKAYGDYLRLTDKKNNERK